MIEELLIALVLLTPIAIAIAFLVKLVQVSGKVKKLEAQVARMVQRMEGGAPASQDVKAPGLAAREVSESLRDLRTRADVPAAEDVSTQGATVTNEVPPPLPVDAGMEETAMPAAREVPESLRDPRTRSEVPRAPKSAAHSAFQTSNLEPHTSPQKRTRGEWESLIGGKWLNRIGAFALIIAMGFFLKYAFDNNLINETMRVGIGAAIGLGLVAGGWWAERKGLRVFAQGLVGAGISTLYISVYASFNFYHLVPQIPAFALMSGVTALTLYQAFRYDSVAVAILGLLGGFLTPFFLSTGSVNTVGLFTYVALLDAGLIVIVLYKDRWAVLDIMALAGTYIIYLVWYDEFYTAAEGQTALLFLAGFWALFFTAEMVRTWLGCVTFVALRQITYALSAVLFYCSMYVILDADFPRLTSLIVLLLGVIYITASLLAYQRGIGESASGVRTTVTGALLLALAITIDYDNYPVISLLFAEALLFAIAGWRLKLNHVRITALVLWAIAYFCMFYVPGAAGVGVYNAADFAPVLNLRTAAWMALIGASIFMSWLESRSGHGAKTVADALHAGWALGLFILVSVEVSDAFVRGMTGMAVEAKQVLRFHQMLTVTLFTAAFSTALTWLGARRELVSVRVTGLSLVFISMLAAALAGWRYIPIEEFAPVVNVRFAVLLLVAIALLAQGYIIKKRFHERDWQTALSGTLRVTASLLLLILVTVEVLDFYVAKILAVRASGLTGASLAGTLRPLENMQQLALSIAWLVFSIALMAYGFLRKVVVQRIVAFAVFGISILKIFIYDLQFLDTLYRIFSFIGLGIILLVVSYLYTRYKDVIVGKEDLSVISEQ